MATSSTPFISMHWVTRSVPISPEPITPMRTGLPSSARRARSRARPVRAMLVMRVFRLEPHSALTGALAAVQRE